MFLLVVITFAIYQTTTETFKLREVLSTEGDFYNSVRLSMSVFQKDIENAHSPLSIRPEVSASPNPASASGQDTDLTVSEFYANRRDPLGIRATRLNGKEATLTWVSNSNLRMYRDSRESEFLKVRYELVNEADEEYEPGLKTLVRTVSTDAFEYDEDKDKSRKTYPLLHGIKSWKFRYYSKNKKEWLSTWDSDSNDHQDLFPDLIEVQLEVKAPKGLSFEGLYHFKPELPLNGVPATL